MKHQRKMERLSRLSARWRARCYRGCSCKQGAVGCGRLRPRCCRMANCTKHITPRLWLWPIRFIM